MGSPVVYIVFVDGENVHTLADRLSSPFMHLENYVLHLIL